MSLTYDDVAQILRIIDQDGIHELRLEQGDFSLTVRKGPPSQPAAVDEGPRVHSVTTGTEATAAPSPRLAATAGSTERSAPSSAAVALVAPMPGTFYRSPAPGEQPFASVGDHVKAGAVVCILDVMKLMNQLTAPCAGKVVRIDPDDAQAVNAGQALVWFEPER